MPNSCSSHRPSRPFARPPALVGALLVSGALAALFVSTGLATLLLPAAALANGGTLRLANVPMGEYRVSVFTDPTPVRPDSLDVSVLVLTRDGEPLADPAEVEVRVRAELLEPRSGGNEATAPPGQPLVRPATREEADDPRYLSAKFSLGAEGRWRIAVALEGPRGAGEADFEVDARRRGLLGHPLVVVVLALLPLAGAAWWVLGTDRKGAAAS